MITEQKALDDLITEAMQPDNDAAVMKLVTELRTTDQKLLRESAANFDLMLESWDESVQQMEEKAEVCLLLAEYSVLDTPNFRLALQGAIRKFLPPYISSQGMVKAVGARDTAVCVRDVALRLKKIQKLKNNALVFQMESRTWGRIVNVDKLVASLVVSTYATGGQLSIPVSSALSGCTFFEPAPDMTAVIGTNKSNLRPAAYYKTLFAKNALGDISEGKIHDILNKMLVPGVMSAEEFAAWFNMKETEKKAVTGARPFYNARSLLELYTLLGKIEDPAEISLDAESASHIATLFSHLKSALSPKDLEMLAECIAMMAHAAGPDVLKPVFEPLRGKVAFFPAQITSNIPLQQLEIWGRLPVKHFAGFLSAAMLFYSKYELAKLAMILPLRCINVILEKLDLNDITDAIFAAEHINSDMLLAIWKNRSKFPADVTGSITMANISAVLSVEGLPKEWAAAQRELKKNLFEKADFQKFVLANAGQNIVSVIAPIQRMRNMAPGECQSLLVKLSRHSAELKRHIESGEGLKLMAAQGAGVKGPDAALMTSLLSYKGLVAELDNIVKVQVPENNKAIEIARGFGDFRENAEYDAAKERRSFLRRRRGELESLVATVQAINFTTMKVDTSKVSMGVAVTLDDGGKATEYYVLGAFDGDPDKNRVSYKTKFGEVLLGAKVGDQLSLPDGRKVSVKAIATLPAELAKELSPENN